MLETGGRGEATRVAMPPSLSGKGGINRAGDTGVGVGGKTLRGESSHLRSKCLVLLAILLALLALQRKFYFSPMALEINTKSPAYDSFLNPQKRHGKRIPFL